MQGVWKTGGGYGRPATIHSSSQSMFVSPIPLKKPTDAEELCPIYLVHVTEAVAEEGEVNVFHI